jgi:hypothetical protein
MKYLKTHPRFSGYILAMFFCSVVFLLFIIKIIHPVNIQFENGMKNIWLFPYFGFIGLMCFSFAFSSFLMSDDISFFNEDGYDTTTAAQKFAGSLFVSGCVIIVASLIGFLFAGLLSL